MSPSAERLVRLQVRTLRAYAVEEPPPRAVKLDANENPHATPPDVMARVLKSAAGLALNRYPDPAATELRGLLAGRWGWKAEGILLGNGSDELIALLAAACGGPEATLLIPTPTFSMYRHICLAAGWCVEEVPLAPGFALDEAAVLERAHRTSPRLAVFASPNNPTGNCFDAKALGRIAAEVPGVVVVDEAYFDFSGRTLLPLLAERPNLVLLRTLSKVGLAALRLGALLGSPELVTQLDKVRLPFNVGSFPQLAAAAALREPGFIAEQVRSIVSERGRVAAALPALGGVEVFPSDANFLLFRTKIPSGEVFERLRGAGVLVRDLGGASGPLERCLRVTIGTPEENDAFLAGLEKALG